MQVYGKTRRDCELIPLSPGFNYPQIHAFMNLSYTVLGSDLRTGYIEKGDRDTEWLEQHEVPTQTDSCAVL